MGRAFLPQMDRTVERTTLDEVTEVIIPVTFEEFFTTNSEDLYGSLWLVTRHRFEAEEIAQEAFLKVWERWDRVTEMDDPVGYLYRTAMNVWRSRGRRAAVAIRRVIHAIQADDGLAHIEERDVVVRALAPLTPRQRAALVLTDLLGLTSEEAGKALGVRPSTVRVLAARGRERLREEMEERG
jgi:RNA polymerase sigma-70 factor (ECF subfamily)